MDLEIPRRFTDFAVWLGSPVVAGFVLSWLAENFAYFGDLSARMKNFALIVVSLVLMALSYGLQQIAPETLEQIEPYWQGIIFPAVVAYLATQGAHWLRKRNGE